MNKPRLIDANALLNALALEPMENRTYWRANEIVLEQPTAYDIDKVVEQLLSPSCIGVEYTHGMSKDEIAESVLEQSVNRAIEIVTGGVE